MTKMLRDVRKAGTHGHVFCSSLHFALWFLNFAENCTSLASHHEYLESEGVEGKTVQKRTVFGIATSALRYTRYVCDVQEAAAAKQTAHTSVLETGIHF